MLHIDNIYGEFEISGVLEQLINTKAFQRLKKIHQGGAIFLVNPTMNQTRYDHSIGVMLLIRQLGGSIEEQIAGLLHDISHTAFSHLIDYILELETEDYHEKRYVEVLKDSEINAVLNANQFDVGDFLDLEKYKMLEYPLPCLSADRIDYTLRDLLQLGIISRNEIAWFLEDLFIQDGRIVLTSAEHAKWFQTKYEYLINNYFSSKENIEINLIMKKIVKDCLRQGIIEEKDFHRDDFYLMAKMNAAFDVKMRIEDVRRSGLDSKNLKMKKRWVDPEILINNLVFKLSEMN